MEPTPAPAPRAEIPARDRAIRALVSVAAAVVVLAGLRAAGDVLLPVILSVFLSILAMPAVKFLRRLGLPSELSILVVVLAVGAALVGFTAMVVGTARTFATHIPQYEAPLRELLANTMLQLEGFGLEPADRDDLLGMLTPEDVMALVGHTLGATVEVLSKLVIVILTTAFILLEESEIGEKMAAAFGSHGPRSSPFARAPEDVQRYLFIKSVVSLATGLFVGLWCYLLGLDFPVLWGILAFLLNYIPAIGSNLAAIPPILLAIVQLGWMGALGIAFGYLVVHVLLANLLEPRLLGRSLGLSPLVVFLSLLFWGWLWGPAGMLVCVPMTVIAKLVLESSDDTRWLAVLLGPAKEIEFEDGQHPPGRRATR